MVRSATLTFTAAKKKTRIENFRVEPVAGIVPFDLYFEGWLKDETGWGLGNKTVEVFVNGVRVKSLLTYQAPAWAMGDLGKFWERVRITEAGTHQIYIEFAGDAEYEGCEENGAVGQFVW